MDKIVKAIFKKTDMDNENERKEAYGKFSGIVGIIANILLFAGKFIAGTVFSSVAVVADGFNNLSDAGSSLISFVSFKLSGKPADKEHPYGHARIEYITSMIVSFLILTVGIDLLKTSVEKILNPEESQFSIIMMIVLAASIVVKLGLYIMNRTLGKKVKSIMLLATATDSLSDTLATTVVVISLIIGELFAINLDGYMGVLVAGFIIFAGIRVLRDTMNSIIGTAPELEFKEEIAKFVKDYDPLILGTHDLMVHSYGTGNYFASIHVEVSGKENFYACHDIIDNVEKDIRDKMNVHLVIHLDPIEADDEAVGIVRTKVSDDVCKLGKELQSEFSIHDFRMVPGETHTNLIFDVVVPFDCKYSGREIAKLVKSRIEKFDGNYVAVVNIDRP